MEEFIFGVIFTIAILPIIQDGIGLIDQTFQYLKALIALKVSKINDQLSSDDDDDQQEDTIQKHYGFIPSNDLSSKTIDTDKKEC